LKRYEEALASYDKRRVLKVLDADGYQISRGNLFAELGRYDEALAAYESYRAEAGQSRGPSQPRQHADGAEPPRKALGLAKDPSR